MTKLVDVKPEYLWYSRREMTSEIEAYNRYAISYAITESERQANPEDRRVERVPVFINEYSDIHDTIAIIAEGFPQINLPNVLMHPMPNREVIVYQGPDNFSGPGDYTKHAWIFVLTPKCPSCFDAYIPEDSLCYLHSQELQEPTDGIEFKDMYGERIQLREREFDGEIGLYIDLPGPTDKIMCSQAARYGHPRLAGNGWQPYCGFPDGAMQHTGIRLNREDIVALVATLRGYLATENLGEGGMNLALEEADILARYTSLFSIQGIRSRLALTALRIFQYFSGKSK